VAVTNKFKVCFVTDGGQTMGMGHVQQSVSLANKLRQHADISFLTKSNEAVETAVRQAGFDVARLQDDVEVFEELKRVDPAVVIFDKIDVDEGLAAKIKKNLRARLVIFTNLTPANRHADLAVTADIGSQFKNVSYRDEETGTRYYFGPKYWVLRPEFYEYKAKKKVPKASPEQILLLFGGSDPANLTAVALHQLLGMDRPYQIDVVIGAQYSHHSALQDVTDRFASKSRRVAVYKNIRNVAELMFRADLTIASPGLSAFESLCVGTPIIVVPHNKLQADTYRGFMQMLERSEIGKLDGMIERGEFTFSHDAQIAAMEIGEGADELARAIVALARGQKR
jgi:spore coat polysaccharide biosynthesis predicted glycosyltransferase SpsG